jgi:hypothetical protein
MGYSATMRKSAMLSSVGESSSVCKIQPPNDHDTNPTVAII